MTAENFHTYWARKTVKQIEKEIQSWRKYMQKHSAAYAWHGKDITPPGELADGDKLCILREILSTKTATA